MTEELTATMLTFAENLRDILGENFISFVFLSHLAALLSPIAR